jgi:diguanylate cyclase (GGDEF)-like protein
MFGAPLRRGAIASLATPDGPATIVGVIGGAARWLSSPRVKRPVVIAAVLVVPLVGWVDYRADPVVQLDLFYVLPIICVAWSAGRQLGLLVTAYVVAVSAVVADLQSGAVAATLNGITQLVMFGSLVLLVTSIRRLLDEHRTLAGIDPLTHLLNRRAFCDAVAVELQRAKRNCTLGTVVYFDIDQLKAINDRYGHTIGDAAIVGVADAARSCARQTDLVVRLGGDEFAAYLPATSSADAQAFAERLMAQLSSNEPPVSISVGLLTHAPDDTTVGALLERADSTMYDAKRMGGGKLLIARPTD